MSAISCAAIIVATLIVVAALELPACAWIIGRLKRRARSYVDLTLWHPDVPGVDDVFPADTPIEVIEQAIFNRVFVEIVCDEFPYERDRFAS